MRKIRPNILWITLDAVRADRLSCYSYKRNTTPFLSRLAKKSLIFKNAISNSIWTFPSVASMFTGKYPSEHGMTDHLRKKIKLPTIAEILSDLGYQSVLLGGPEWVSSTNLRKGFDEVYTREDIFYSNSFFPKPQLRGTSRQIYKTLATPPSLLSQRSLTLSSTPQIVNMVEKKTESLREPFFFYLHFLDSHLPYEPPLNFQKFGRKNIFLPGILGKRIDFWSNWSEKRNHSLIGEKAFSSEEIKIMRDAYDNTLLFADYQIQKIFQMLIKKNLLQNTILIITADHGEMLGESGKFGHQLCLKEPLLHVPLIIYSPKIQQKKETNIIETKDIFNIVSYLSKNGFEISYPKRDYAYGEYKANKQFKEDILKLDPKKFTSAEFIRTDKFKLVSYNRGNKKLFRLDGEEIEIDNEETKDIMEELLRRKKTQIEKSRISNTVKDRL